MNPYDPPDSGDSAATEQLAEGRYLRFSRRGRWEFVERREVSGIVAVVALTDDDRLLLVEQWREAVRRRCIELPAGLVDPGETLAEAAARELMEETGYRAARFDPLFEGPPSAGLSAELIWFFRAHGLSRIGAGGGDDAEQIAVHAIPRDEIAGWLAAAPARGLTIDPKLFVGLFCAGVSCPSGWPDSFIPL